MASTGRSRLSWDVLNWMKNVFSNCYPENMDDVFVSSVKNLTITLHSVHSDFTYNYYDKRSCFFQNQNS
jgi:hypothetical protein